jgi:hypothetical protein
VLRAEGQRTAAILKAEGEAKAIETVFGAIHEGAPDPALLSYQYLQMLPQLAQGEANKVFVIPSEFSQALGGLADRFAQAGAPNGLPARPQKPAASHERTEAAEKAAADAAEAAKAARDASAEASAAATPGMPHHTPETPPEST